MAFDNLILAAALRYSIPSALIRAVIEAESGGDPNAFNPEREGNPSRGLMQIRESTARGLGYSGDPGPAARGDGSGLFDPRTNIDLGAKLLRQLWDRFSGNVGDVIAAYNGGPKIATQRLPGQPYRNQAYVDKVLGFASRYGLTPLTVTPAVLLATVLVVFWLRRRKRRR